MNSELLRIEDLHKSFGGLEVLRGIDLKVDIGEVVVLIGPSGCGKSTLLRCINYLESPTSGKIWFDGDWLGQKSVNGRLVARSEHELDRQRERIGMVFQRFNLFPHMSAIGNVIQPLVLVKQVPRSQATETAERLLSRVGLFDKKDVYPHRLSGGEQQRVAIARALAMEPLLMLFDEATSALDPELVDDVLSVMFDLAAEGKTMLVVTHEMDFASEVASRVVFMDEGLVIEEGPPSKMFQLPESPRAQKFLSKVLRRQGRKPSP